MNNNFESFPDQPSNEDLYNEQLSTLIDLFEEKIDDTTGLGKFIYDKNDDGFVWGCKVYKVNIGNDTTEYHLYTESDERILSDEIQGRHALRVTRVELPDSKVKYDSALYFPVSQAEENEPIGYVTLDEMGYEEMTKFVSNIHYSLSTF